MADASSWEPGQPTAAGAFVLREADREAYHHQDQCGRLAALARTMLAMPKEQARELAAAITKRHGRTFMDAVRSHVASFKAAGICQESQPGR